MAKKSTATRQQSTPPRRPQTARSSNVTLVRAPGAASTEKSTTASRSTPEAGTTQASAPATGAGNKPVLETPRAEKPVTQKPAPSAPAVVRPRAPEISTRPKGAAPRTQPNQQPSQPAAGSAATKAQAVRAARARAVQRARAANLVTPEHFAYVIRDLRLIAVLACAMVIVLIVLHFALPV